MTACFEVKNLCWWGNSVAKQKYSKVRNLPSLLKFSCLKCFKIPVHHVGGDGARAEI